MSMLYSGDTCLSGAGTKVGKSESELTSRSARTPLRRDDVDPVGTSAIVGRSAALRRVLEQIEHVAATDATVLLLGDTGTGKELFATRLHELSARRTREMLRVNCAAIPSTLMESELFGCERGAFTDAVARRIGRFELANHSTIFLDEIGDLPADVQVKLLRVLEERQIERLGSPNSIPVDVRIVAATHRRPRTAHRQRVVPGGPLLPIERVPDPRAGAPRAGRRHSPPRMALRRTVLEVARQADRRHSPRKYEQAAGVPVAWEHPGTAKCRGTRDDRGGRFAADGSRPVGNAGSPPVQRQAD